MINEDRHVIVTYEPTAWAAVPANNGANGPTWQWGDEILVGFTWGIFSDRRSGHQCSNDHPFESWLARSTDGGESWDAWQPEPYAGQDPPAAECPCCDHPVGPFTDPGFVARIEGNGYHGNRGARWFVSQDKGAAWLGPFGFGGLMEHPALQGLEFTGRTAYEVRGARSLDLYLSARIQPGTGALNVVYDKAFLARTTDGGATFEFISWLVDEDDPYRAVMPAPVRLSPSDLVVALRRKSATENWVDCFASGDDGATWSLRSRVGKTEDGNQFNGNPPAMVRLTDGRLCCAYGNRSRCQIVARLSDDEGQTWSPERILRDDFQSVNGWPDLGYCRLFQRTDGRLVVVTFWCAPDRPQTHIEATIWTP